jgi:hypothetical protein
MAKLGYTWYPKDWGNSESVFELSLSERGLYREFIDLAMLNDNTTEIKKDVWIRKFCVSKEDLDFILCKLISLNLVEIIDDILFIPSCESRLKLVRGGSNGGKKSKPTKKPNNKPTQKPFESLEENNEKPDPKQIEKKDKRKENINEYFNSLLMGSEIETIASNNKLTIKQAKEVVEIFRTKSELHYDNYNAFVRHFKNWLPLNKNLIKKDTKGSFEDNTW